MTRSFWNQKKVFLTGHTGFKGAWLALWLRESGAIVTGLALPPEELSLYRILRLENDLSREVFADLADSRALSEAVQSAQPDVVLHLAAQSLVRRSYREPLETMRTNVLGTAHLLHACRDVSSVRAILVVTTDKCYENPESGTPFRETDPLGGFDPYSASKACAEIVTSSFTRSFFRSTRTAVASARAGNVIGGGDFSEDRLIPDIVRAVRDGATLEIRSPGSVRPWQHVLEPLGGYLQLAQALFERGKDVEGPWNFGPAAESEKTVWDLVEALQTRIPGLKATKGTPPPELHEAKHLTLDIRKARELLGWKPRLDFQTQIEWTAEWYNRYLQGSIDLRALCLDQIRSYEAR